MVNLYAPYLAVFAPAGQNLPVLFEKNFSFCVENVMKLGRSCDIIEAVFHLKAGFVFILTANIRNIRQM